MLLALERRWAFGTYPTRHPSPTMSLDIIPYRPKALARQLRCRMTPGAVVLWNFLWNYWSSSKHVATGRFWRRATD